MENLKITFLGGIDEIGKNMTVYEYANDIIVVDSGLAFPDEAMPGVDLVVQDISYLIANKSKIRGIFITHGHEDHIGSIPYLLENIKAPIYGSRVSLGLIENKLKEARRTNVVLKSVQAGSVVAAGNFKVEFVSVTHSIPGSMALVLTTPAGVVVHTGDFKVDFTPVGNDVCDLKRLSEVGKKGVDLLLCESTNVEREGFSMSESVVGKTFDELFKKLLNKRIIVATFASNIHRLQQIIDNAVKYKRKIAFTGRSMINVSDMAIKLGELRCDKEIIIDIDRIDKYEDKELIIISTGSQGESMSALTRMASDNFPKIKLNENDAVILSSAPIPGNEKAVNTVINNLYRKGCQIIYNELADVHASGHAYKEELKILHSLIKPRFFIPIHGEYRHLKNHQMLAKSLGMKDREIIIPELGMQVEVNKDVLKVVGQVQAGIVLIDGTGVGDMDSNVIRDRLTLSQDGVCAVVCQISRASRSLVGAPEIISRGFIYQEEASDIITEAKETIAQNLSNYDLKAMDLNEIKATIRKVSTNYFFKKTKRRPMVLSVVVEVDAEPQKQMSRKKATPKTTLDMEPLTFVLSGGANVQAIQIEDKSTKSSKKDMTATANTTKKKSKQVKNTKQNGGQDSKKNGSSASKEKKVKNSQVKSLQNNAKSKENNGAKKEKQTNKNLKVKNTKSKSTSLDNAKVGDKVSVSKIEKAKKLARRRFISRRFKNTKETKEGTIINGN